MTLTVTKAGLGAGEIVSSPAGLLCGANCTASFPLGTVVTLNATAANGASFAGWAGPCSGTGACVVTLASARAVTATFAGLGAQTVELQPGPGEATDTQIVFAEGPALGTHGNKNFGTAGQLAAGCYDHNTIGRSLLRFEFPTSIKPGRVVSAQLVLQPYAWVEKDPVGPLSIYVHKMLKSWKQGTATELGAANSATIDGATGSERYFGSSWSVIGVALGDVDASATYGASVSKTYDRRVPDLSSWTFDVTAYVQDWVNTPASNYGFLLKSNEYFTSATGDSYSYPQFHSGESAEASKRPKLVVTYNP